MYRIVISSDSVSQDGRDTPLAVIQISNAPGPEATPFIGTYTVNRFTPEGAQVGEAVTLRHVPRGQGSLRLARLAMEALDKQEAVRGRKVRDA